MPFLLIHTTNLKHGHSYTPPPHPVHQASPDPRQSIFSIKINIVQYRGQEQALQVKYTNNCMRQGLYHSLLAKNNIIRRSALLLFADVNITKHN